MLQLFAPSQEYFAAVSEDNRLRVWDVVRTVHTHAHACCNGVDRPL